MKFSKPARPKHGTKRIVTEFLLSPKTIGRETRWLETASWEEEFVPPTNCDPMWGEPSRWEPVHWVDKIGG